MCAHLAFLPPDFVHNGIIIKYNIKSRKLYHLIANWDGIEWLESNSTGIKHRGALTLASVGALFSDPLNVDVGRFFV
jgi:hypothetical protein